MERAVAYVHFKFESFCCHICLKDNKDGYASTYDLCEFVSDTKVAPSIRNEEKDKKTNKTETKIKNVTMRMAMVER